MNPIGRSDLRYFNLIGWLFVAAVLLLVCQRALQKDQQRDFIYFYSLGYIANHYPADRIYDYDLQKQIYARFQPIDDFAYGPSPHPPFVAALFSPFALLPYLTAYILWMAVTLVFYLAGTGLLLFRFHPGDSLKQSLILCFALLFWPFTLRTLLNGHIAAIGFLAMALALYCEDRRSWFPSGLALSLCLYKPTLLFLTIPMLIVIGRWRTLAGFLVGSVSLAVAATVLLGPDVWPGYLRMVLNLGQFLPYLDFADHVDLYSFASLAANGAVAVRILVLVAAIAACLYLLRLWWHSRQAVGHQSAVALWAATVVWTLLLNVYVPIQDTNVVVIALIACAPLLTHRCGAFISVCLLLLFIPPATKWFAGRTGIQAYTLLLAYLAVLLTGIAARSVRLKPGHPLTSGPDLV
jgi:hypothetical protein